MKDEKFSSIKFDEVAFPRYIKVKEAIEALTKVIDFNKVKQDGMDRVLHAILQLIDENDDKTIDEKRVEIEDAIYNGNVFKHYFSEENQTKAVDILSRTSLLNDEERLIYIINFFMPGDIHFTSTYSKNDKNIERIAEAYNLTSDDAANLVFARVSEISKFYKLYQEEKERQKIQTLAAMQDATEEPNPENIDRVKGLLDNLADANLRETLEQQLQSLEQVESIPEIVEPIEELEEFMPEELGQEITIDDEPVNEDLEEEKPIEAEQPMVSEPEPLDVVLNEDKEEKTESHLGQDVMASLRNLVEGARNSEQRAEQLSLDLEMKDEKIKELESTISSQQQQVDDANQIIEAKNKELADKDKKIEEQDAKIDALTAEIEAKDKSLAEADKVIASKDEEIKALTTSLQSYKTSLSEIQNFLSSAQYGVEIDENPRKVA